MPSSTKCEQRKIEYVLDVPVDALGWSDAVSRISAWAREGESRVVCICNVHSVVTAARNPAHAEAIDSADLVTPDGAPLAWVLRRKGRRDQERISGPDLMWTLCGEAPGSGIRMFLYGSTPATLARLEQRLRDAFPGIVIAGSLSPPFRELSVDEDAAIVDMINASGAQIVWVGLGCPKQEAWMRAHRGRVRAVMIGVGAAFDFHSGAVRRAPVWFQRHGLEWLHRLLQDPRRLAMRYLVTNSIFIGGVLREMVFTAGRHAHAGTRDTGKP